MTKDTYESLSTDLSFQLLQLITIVHEDDLLSDKSRDTLLDLGFCHSYGEWSVITPQGIKYLSESGFLDQLQMANLKTLARENSSFYEGNQISVTEIGIEKWRVTISGRISHTEIIEADGLFDATNKAFQILYKEQKL